MTRTARLMHARVGLRRVCSVINPELDRLARSRYVSLTTYRRSGAPVSTPVWVASEGGYLQVLCHEGDAVLERLENGTDVRVAPCDQRGGVQGDAVDATATVIADPGLVSRVQELIGNRYGPAALLHSSSNALTKTR